MGKIRGVFISGAGGGEVADGGHCEETEVTSPVLREHRVKLEVPGQADQGRTV